MIAQTISDSLNNYIKTYDLTPDAVMHLERYTAQLLGAIKPVKDKCPLCEASMKAHWHKMSPILVNCLVKMRGAVILQNKNRIHLLKDLQLTKVEYNNFQKLRFFGLIAHYQENGKKVEGTWLLTRLGSQFLNGEAKIPSRVQTFRNHIIKKDDKYVTVGQVIGKVPYLQTRSEFDSEILDFLTLSAY